MRDLNNKTHMRRVYCGECRHVMDIPVEKAGMPEQCENCHEYLIVPKGSYSPNVVIGDYVLHDEIGTGGCGTVYLAYQISLDRYCAVKILHDAYFKHDEQLEELLNEGRIAGRLHHPKIVQCYSVGEADGVYFYSMEYVEGRTLKQVLEDNWKLTVNRSIDVVSQVIEGLSHAWSKQRLVHRDVKPDNIMVTAEGEVKLADMGLAKPANNTVDEDDDVIKGSPHYISPEQINNTPQDFRSDIYSLGCVLYQCLTGHMIFRAESPQDYCIKHLSEIPQSPAYHNAELPEDLCDIVMKMLEKNPEDRYQDYGNLMRDLQMARQNDLSGTIEFNKPVQEEEPEKSGSKSWLLVPVVAVACAVIFFALPKKDKAESETSDAVIATQVENSELKAATVVEQEVPKVLPKPQAKLSAVLADPAGFDGGNEWVEIRNEGEIEIQLDGWKLKDRDGNAHVMKGSIPVGESFKVQIPMSDFTINNKGDLIILLDGDEQEFDCWELKGKDIVKAEVLTR